MDDSGVQLNQQPGQTIKPTTGPAAEPPAEPAPESPTPPAPSPEPTPAPEPPTPAPAPEPPAETPQTSPEPEVPAASPEPQAPADSPMPEPSPEEEPKFDNSQPESSDEFAGDPADVAPITWTASEFIAHAKSFGWYAGLTLAALALSALVFLITKDPVSVGVVIFAAIIFGFYAGHKPRELEYRLDSLGLNIGQKHFGYSQFRCFSVLPEGGISSIVFMPLKRFSMPTTIYYPPEEENKIVNLLGSRLPLEERGHDAIDRLMHRIHF